MNNGHDERFTIREINGRTDIESISASYTAKRREARSKGITGRTNILAHADLDEDELLFHVTSAIYAERKNMAWEGFETTDEDIAANILEALQELKFKITSITGA